jgi:hypothetical protein
MKLRWLSSIAAVIGVLAFLIWLNTYPSGRGQHSEDDDENDLFKHLTDSSGQDELGRILASSQPEPQIYIIHSESGAKALFTKVRNCIFKR